jgi:deoxycytidylate deaminase
MTKRISNGVKYAIVAAKKGDFRRSKVGASIFYKGRCIKVGWNKKKSHPECPTKHSQHAEFNACIGLDKSYLSKCILYVVRLTSNGELGIAKPCEICEKFILSMNIKRVYYTNRNGQIEQL